VSFTESHRQIKIN